MDAKQVVTVAKTFILDLYEEESPTNVGLEEIELDQASNEWVVTVGFSRPWDEPRNALAALAAPPATRRSFKVVRIADGSGQVLSVKNREVRS
jgi:hypothetical protein